MQQLYSFIPNTILGPNISFHRSFFFSSFFSNITRLNSRNVFVTYTFGYVTNLNYWICTIVFLRYNMREKPILKECFCGKIDLSMLDSLRQKPQKTFKVLEIRGLCIKLQKYYEFCCYTIDNTFYLLQKLLNSRLICKPPFSTKFLKFNIQT